MLGQYTMLNATQDLNKIISNYLNFFLLDPCNIPFGIYQKNTKLYTQKYKICFKVPGFSVILSTKIHYTGIMINDPVLQHQLNSIFFLKNNRG